ncbi:hypothetical protein [Secundilactobacillus silagei]|uniref:Uncharacterized protein n=1 Tax=Secundilactobacillus silagei JCM 19001 TaxID=1302250 RepID=A0A1Z5IG48_9LACO|nr:hypothetical protein [Secundilactobacillus silagei]TDG73267.1 hypothetical protein C5L25_000416 [Secundilactobacillus silagei JCM 19001]GAX00638.1 hypothetical protein IWT126_00653 [Secundilactobacillus silagei JCM 19001]
MHFKKLIMLVITALSLGIGVGISQTNAQAATNYMPRSWRGIYYCSFNHTLFVLHAHSVQVDGRTTLRSNGHGYHRIAFHKIKTLHHHGYYQFEYAEYEYESSGMWSMRHKHGHIELLQYVTGGGGNPLVFHKY